MSKIVVGEIDWMRNDYISPLTVGDVEYPSVEHAYQASKFKDRNIKEDIADADSVREARRIGRSASDRVRDDWDDVRFVIMENLVRKKFQDDVLAERLAKTGSANIVMEGYDEFWGTGRNGTGQNHLGNILETVRSEVQFMLDLDPNDEDDSDEEYDAPPTLKDALLNGVDYDLAEVCQEVYDGVRALMTLVDPNDFDAAFVARRTGVSLVMAQSAIEKLQKMQSALNSLKDLLNETDDEPLGLPASAANPTVHQDDPLEDRPVRVLSPSDDGEDEDYDDWLNRFDWD